MARDLAAILDRKQWVQLRESTFAAWRTLEYLAAAGSEDAARAISSMQVVLGRGWHARHVHLDPGCPAPGPDAYRTPADAPQDSYDQWMADRRAARVAITGEARYAAWEQELRSRMPMISRNEEDELLDMLTGLTAA